MNSATVATSHVLSAVPANSSLRRATFFKPTVHVTEIVVQPTSDKHEQSATTVQKDTFNHTGS